jgi:hypothetical protein
MEKGNEMAIKISIALEVIARVNLSLTHVASAFNKPMVRSSS